MNKKEKKYTRALLCRHCNNTTAMEIVTNHRSLKNLADDDPRAMPVMEGDIFQLLVCPACQGVTLGKYFYADYMPDEENDNEATTILYPPSAKFPTALPPRVMSSYQAAVKVRGIDPNAYGVLLGRVLELLCEDRKADGDTLYKKLEDLGKQG